MPSDICLLSSAALVPYIATSCSTAGLATPLNSPRPTDRPAHSCAWHAGDAIMLHTTWVHARPCCTKVLHCTGSTQAPPWHTPMRDSGLARPAPCPQQQKALLAVQGLHTGTGAAGHLHAQAPHACVAATSSMLCNCCTPHRCTQQSGRAGTCACCQANLAR
jgi:hypothetical protein